MELVWALGLGHTGNALPDQLEYLDFALASAVRVEEECSKLCSLVPLSLERGPEIPLLFGRCSRVSEWISFLYSLGTL